MWKRELKKAWSWGNVVISFKLILQYLFRMEVCDIVQETGIKTILKKKKCKKAKWLSEEA